MHLTPKYINIILNILLGVAWALALFGFIYGFNSLSSNFFLKLLNGFIHTTFALFIVVVLEAVYAIFEIREKLNSSD
jgi:hypothetical protein